MSCTRFIVADEHLAPPDGMRLKTYAMDGVHAFKARDRDPAAVNELIIHESVTRSAASTVAVLKRRKLGVHLIVTADRTVYQHADLATERLDREGLTVTAMLLPAALLGIAAGHGLHDRVDETRFRTFVWSSLMVASGLLLAG